VIRYDEGSLFGRLGASGNGGGWSVACVQRVGRAGRQLTDSWSGFGVEFWLG
jgi:hypothetical protein